MFLMYRVELKVEFSDVISDFRMTVPNVPCGVESSAPDKGLNCLYLVPNVPCGVERLGGERTPEDDERFLMYRVELKALRPHHAKLSPQSS